MWALDRETGYVLEADAPLTLRGAPKYIAESFVVCSVCFQLYVLCTNILAYIIAVVMARERLAFAKRNVLLLRGTLHPV